MSEIHMPRLSDTMEEGVISSWVKNVGDKVSAGDILVEIETDKAVMEYESYEDGYLVKQTASEGETVPIGEVIGILGDSPDAVPEDTGAGAPPEDKGEDKAEEKPEGKPEARSEEHTSELQSRFDIVCRLLLENKTI